MEGFKNMATPSDPFDGTQLCVEEDAEIFFPEDYSDLKAVDKAKSFCDECHLVVACLDYALKDSWLEGIWGATTPGERKVIRARRRRNERRKAQL